MGNRTPIAPHQSFRLSFSLSPSTCVSKLSSSVQNQSKILAEGCRAVFREWLFGKTRKSTQGIPTRYFQGLFRRIGGKKPVKTCWVLDFLLRRIKKKWPLTVASFYDPSQPRVISVQSWYLTSLINLSFCRFVLTVSIFVPFSSSGNLLLHIHFLVSEML